MTLKPVVKSDSRLHAAKESRDAASEPSGNVIITHAPAVKYQKNSPMPLYAPAVSSMTPSAALTAEYATAFEPLVLFTPITLFPR